MKFPRFIFVLAALEALAGCPTAASGPTYTVHGTVYYNSAETGDAVVMVTEGSNSYSVSVPIVAGNGSWAYSVAGVPAGTYSISLSYPTLAALIGFAGGVYYWIDGGTHNPVTAITGPSGFVTATVDNMAVNADFQLDAIISVP